MKIKKLLTKTSNNFHKSSHGITQARIRQKRSGISLSTHEIIKFNLDHALARDSIHAKWNLQKTTQWCLKYSFRIEQIRTKAATRQEYLINPNLGKMVLDEDLKLLKKHKNKYKIVLIVTDGLSAQAIEKHFCKFLKIFQNQASISEFSTLPIAPIIFAPYGRVGLSDHIGSFIGAQIAIIFVGERPGLSASMHPS